MTDTTDLLVLFMPSGRRSLLPHPEVRAQRASKGEGAMARRSRFRDKMPASRKVRQVARLRRDQRFLLAARPALDLPFASDGGIDTVMDFHKDQRHGTAARCEASFISRVVVFPNASVNVFPSQSGVIGTVGTSHDIHGCDHPMTPALRGSLRSHLRMRVMVTTPMQREKTARI